MPLDPQNFTLANLKALTGHQESQCLAQCSQSLPSPRDHLPIIYERWICPNVGIHFYKEGSSTVPSFGTYQDFITYFTTAFVHEDTKGEAIEWFTNTCILKGLLLNDYISQFQNNAEISGITNKDTLINFFLGGIPTSLMRRVDSMDTVPNTIEEWYKQAIHFKVQWVRADAI